MKRVVDPVPGKLEMAIFYSLSFITLLLILALGYIGSNTQNKNYEMTKPIVKSPMMCALFGLSVVNAATAQTSTRLLPAEYGYTMTGEPTISTARLQSLYPDAFDPLLPAKSAPANPDTMAYCLRVYDGDTYRVRYTITQPDTADTFENIRLDGVDCDEILRASVPQPFGQIAADSIRGRILGAYLTFRVSGRDKYNQTVGRAWLDGKDLALLILEKGWGQYVPLNSLDKDTRKAYQKARDRARKKKLGRWANLDVIDPSQWRAILKK